MQKKFDRDISNLLHAKNIEIITFFAYKSQNNVEIKGEKDGKIATKPKKHEKTALKKDTISLRNKNFL